MPDSFDLGTVPGATNWITPAWSILNEIVRGGGYQFVIMPCHVTGSEIQRMLQKNGVATWGLMHVVVGNRIMISVATQDARRAYALLEQAEVPVENPPPQQARQSSPKRKPERKGSPFGVFDEVFRR